MGASPFCQVDVTGLAWEFPVQKLQEDMEVAPVCLIWYKGSGIEELFRAWNFWDDDEKYLH